MSLSRLPRSKSSTALRPPSATNGAKPPIPGQPPVQMGRLRKPSAPESVLGREGSSARTQQHKSNPPSLQPCIPQLKQPAQVPKPAHSLKYKPSARALTGHQAKPPLKASSTQPTSTRTISRGSSNPSSTFTSPASEENRPLRSSRSLATIHKSQPSKIPPPTSTKRNPHFPVKDVNGAEQINPHSTRDTALGGTKMIPAIKRPPSPKVHSDSVFGFDSPPTSAVIRKAPSTNGLRKTPTSRLPPPLEGTSLRVPKPLCPEKSPLESPTPRQGTRARRFSPGPLSPQSRRTDTPTRRLSPLSPQSRRTDARIPILRQQSPQPTPLTSLPRPRFKLQPETPAISTYLRQLRQSHTENLDPDMTDSILHLDSSGLELTPPCRSFDVQLDPNPNPDPSSPSPLLRPIRRRSLLSGGMGVPCQPRRMSSSSNSELTRLTAERNTLEARVTELLLQQERMQVISEGVVRDCESAREAAKRAEGERVQMVWEGVVRECEEAINEVKVVRGVITALREIV